MYNDQNVFRGYIACKYFEGKYQMKSTVLQTYLMMLLCSTGMVSQDVMAWNPFSKKTAEVAAPAQGAAAPTDLANIAAAAQVAAAAASTPAPKVVSEEEVAAIENIVHTAMVIKMGLEKQLILLDQFQHEEKTSEDMRIEYMAFITNWLKTAIPIFRLCGKPLNAPYKHALDDGFTPLFSEVLYNKLVMLLSLGEKGDGFKGLIPTNNWDVAAVLDSTILAGEFDTSVALFLLGGLPTHGWMQSLDKEINALNTRLDDQEAQIMTQRALVEKNIKSKFTSKKTRMASEATLSGMQDEFNKQAELLQNYKDIRKVYDVLEHSGWFTLDDAARLQLSREYQNLMRTPNNINATITALLPQGVECSILDHSGMRTLPPFQYALTPAPKTQDTQEATNTRNDNKNNDDSRQNVRQERDDRQEDKDEPRGNTRSSNTRAGANSRDNQSSRNSGGRSNAGRYNDEEEAAPSGRRTSGTRSARANSRDSQEAESSRGSRSSAGRTSSSRQSAGRNTEATSRRGASSAENSGFRTSSAPRTSSSAGRSSTTRSSASRSSGGIPDGVSIDNNTIRIENPRSIEIHI